MALAWRCSWLSSHATRSKSLSAGMDRGKINPYKTRFAGVPRQRFRARIVQRSGGKNASFRGLSPTRKSCLLRSGLISEKLPSLANLFVEVCRFCRSIKLRGKVVSGIALITSRKVLWYPLSRVIGVSFIVVRRKVDSSLAVILQWNFWVPLRIWFCMGWFFPWPSLLRGILNMWRGYQAKGNVRATPSVGHFAEERLNGRGKFKFFSDISRPLEAMARCLELNWHFQGRKIFVLYSSEVRERLEWNEGKFCSFFSGQRSTVEEFSLVFSLIVEKPKYYNLLKWRL